MSMPGNSDRMRPETITVYGTDWCGDCLRAKSFLETHSIPHVWIDIDSNPEAAAFVIQVNHGYRSVPTIVFEDGFILVEPSTAQLEAKLKQEV
jgi:mycoredoxin